MRILALETSTPFGSVALVEGETPVAHCGVQASKGHAGFLLPVIDDLLTKIDWDIKEIDGICCGVGPGSFASLRVGLSTAKGLATATGAATAGVNTLEALAFPFAYAKKTLVVVTDAKKREVYCAFFRGDGGGNLERTEEDMVISPGELARMMEPGALMIGQGAWLYKSVFEKAAGNDLLFAPPFLCYHNAVTIAALGGREIRRGKTSGNFNPHYIRTPDAAEKS